MKSRFLLIATCVLSFVVFVHAKDEANSLIRQEKSRARAHQLHKEAPPDVVTASTAAVWPALGNPAPAYPKDRYPGQAAVIKGILSTLYDMITAAVYFHRNHSNGGAAATIRALGGALGSSSKTDASGSNKSSPVATTKGTTASSTTTDSALPTRPSLSFGLPTTKPLPSLFIGTIITLLWFSLQ